MNGMEDKQAQASVSHGDAATEPIDLAQAFKLLNKANKEDAAGAVEDAETEPGSEAVYNGEDDGEEADDEGSSAPDYSEDDEYDDGDDGGSSVGIDAIDFDSRKQEILRNIQQQAMSEVRKDFKEQSIEYYSLNEITERDEQSGRVMFRNPDVQDARDPEYYFHSRTEAQNFVDSWNKGVDNEFRSAINKKQQELMQKSAPVIQLIDFIPKYEAMDETTQSVFDAIIEPYAIKDNQGREIAFNINLDAAARQAASIAKSLNVAPSRRQAIEETNSQSDADAPAFDMKSGNGESADEAEPKTLGEALKRIDGMRKENK